MKKTLATLVVALACLAILLLLAACQSGGSTGTPPGGPQATATSY